MEVQGVTVPALKAPRERAEKALGKRAILAGATCRLSQTTSVPCHEGGAVCLSVLRQLPAASEQHFCVPSPVLVIGPLQSSRGV